MKRDYLTGLGIAEDLIDKIMAENGKDIEAAKSKFADYEDLKAQVSDANKTIQSFKEMDIDGIKKSADDWKTKAEQAETAAQAKISELQFNHILDGSLTGFKAKNVKAVKALLNMDGLKLNGDEIVGLNEQLDKIKADNDYLFEAEKQEPAIFAGKTGGGSPEMADAFVSSVRKAAGLSETK